MEFIPIASADHAGPAASTAEDITRAAEPLHHTMAYLLRTLKTRRQGLSVTGLERELHMHRKHIGKLIRHLRAWGAVEPVPSALGDDEPHWAITAHGAWMLAEGIACQAAYRPAQAAPNIVPARAWVNSTVRDVYRPPSAPPARAGSMRAYALPSHGACGVPA